MVRSVKKKNNNKRLIAGIIFVAVGLLGLFRVPSDEEPLLLLLGCLVFVLVGCILLFPYFKFLFANRSKKSKTAKSALENYNPPRTSTPEDDVSRVSRMLNNPERDRDLFQAYSEGWVLKYTYERDICLLGYSVEKLLDKCGKQIDFKQEPENEYDNNAVAIYLDGERIGYVYKSQTQDMINDWINRSEPVVGYINRVLENEGKATFKVGFYKHESAFDCVTYSLVKTGKKDFDGISRSDNLLSCGEGDSVSIEYDCDAGGYVVSSLTGDEIGELPQKACETLDELNKGIFAGVLIDVGLTDSDKPKAKVKVFI